VSDRDDEERRRRRLAQALGDALPERTSDELEQGWGEQPDQRRDRRDDDWFKEQVPPHHG